MENKTGRFIAQRRKELGMTQRQLAEQLGVTNKAVSKWETGQGMPDVGMLLELGRALEVTVDELLNGEKEEKAEKPDDTEKSLLDLALGRAEKRMAGIHIGLIDLAGGACFLGALLLTGIQLWYLFRGKGYGMIYLSEWIPLFMTIAAVLLFWAGGACIRALRPVWMRKSGIAAAGAVLAAGIAVCIVCRSPEKETLSLSPGFSHVLCLKTEDSGRTVFYRQRGLIFAVQADVFPFTVKDKIKIQWLEDDVCTLTYESPDDKNTHQYVATYGDRSENGSSYYYVFNAAHGSWKAEGNYGEYTVEVTDGQDAGIRVETPQGTEFYGVDECVQYGTLALVFPGEDPEWTLVLNEDCVIPSGGSSVEEGGTLTLCRVGMERTAPLIMYGKKKER